MNEIVQDYYGKQLQTSSLSIVAHYYLALTQIIH